MLDSNQFIKALEEKDLEGLRKTPKSDLHNHFVLGGDRDYIKAVSGIEIPYYEGVLPSMASMHAWNEKYLGKRFNCKEMRRLLIEASFVQAHKDGIKLLEIGEDVWGLGTFFENDIEQLIEAFQTAHQNFAPEVKLRLQIGLSRHCPIPYLMKCLEAFWGHPAFYSIDLYGDELAQPIEHFVPIYKKAKAHGLRLKAHVGEWGSAQDIKKAVEVLELDEVQHGIAAINSSEVVDYLIKNQIRLNITPTSNVKLSRVKSMKAHPIGTLYRAGVDVTINSDDVLIFDSEVSKEYLRLYESGVLTAGELNEIRLKGLKEVW